MENENNELRDLVDYGRGSGLDAYDPVTARVYSRSNSSWYSTIEINKGSSDGVRENQPVINGKGLVGKVKTVSDGNAVVMLLSDSEFGVSALAARSRPAGLDPAGRGLARRPAARPRAARPRRSARATGSSRPAPSPTASRRRSRQGILIGTVKRVEGEGELDRTIHVTPAADLRSLDFVQVLTKPTTDLRASAGTP